MPFTVAHAAAVLPLRRTGLPVSALVAGSIAPDLLYYLPGPTLRLTHTVAGLVTVDLVLGVAVWLVWRVLLRAPVVAVTPGGVRRHLPRHGDPAPLRRRDVALVPLAVVVGATTHVAWDELTHAGRWGARSVPALAASWAGVPGHQWAQLASSVLGIVVLVVAGTTWWGRRGLQLGGWTWWPWAVVVAVGAVAGLSAAATGSGSLAFRALTAAGSASAATAALLACGWWVRRSAAARRGGPDPTAADAARPALSRR